MNSLDQIWFCQACQKEAEPRYNPFLSWCDSGGVIPEVIRHYDDEVYLPDIRKLQNLFHKRV